MNREVLGHTVANLLSAAVVAESAARSGIRAMLIKGLSLEVHDLRQHRVSGDVDFLVEPGRTPDLVKVLVAGGWFERRAPLSASLLGTYSVTLVRDEWPTDVDVHSDYPGLLVGCERAFEVLWTHRRSAQAAGRPVWIPDLSSSVVLWALHCLRGSRVDPRHSSELRELVDDVLPRLGAEELAALGGRVLDLGADRSLLTIPAFAELVGPQQSTVDKCALDEWERKLAQVHGITPWLEVLRAAEPIRRPFIIWRAVWPCTRDVSLMDPLLVNTPIGRVRSRLRRMGRLIWRVYSRI